MAIPTWSEASRKARTPVLHPLVTTLLILAAMGAVIAGFRLYIRRPAGVTHEDAPGVRSVAVFSGDASEFFEDDVPDEPYVGRRLLVLLCDALSTAGIQIENRGTIHYAQRVECVVGDDRFALVLERAEREWIAGIEWVPTTAAERRHLALTAQVFSPPDSPGFRRLLLALDRCLQNDSRLSSIRWYRREDWLAEDTSRPAQSPVGEE